MGRFLKFIDKELVKVRTIGGECLVIRLVEWQRLFGRGCLQKKNNKSRNYSKSNMFIPSKKNKYYLAGPMSNIPQFNYPRFFELARILREEGFTIVSPAELDSPETVKAAMASPDGSLGSGVVNGETWGDFLARDVKLVADDVDGVFVMEGWESSKGAKLELFVAHLAKKPIFTIKEVNGGLEVNILTETTLFHAITNDTFKYAQYAGVTGQAKPYQPYAGQLTPYGDQYVGG